MKIKKTYLLRLMCFLLVALLSGSALAGCDTTPQESHTEETTTTPLPAETDVTLTLAADGKTDYTIYYAKDLMSDTGLMDIIGTVCTRIKKNTGADIKMSSDRSYNENRADEPAILIGVTQWAESTQTLEQLHLKEGGYYVGVSGNKVVICGKNAEACTNGVMYFLNMIVAVQGKAGTTLTFSTSDTLFESGDYGIESVTCLNRPLYDYRIIIPSNPTVNESMTAKNLRYWLLQEYGYLLELAEDDEAVTDAEILVGKTNRTTVSAEGNTYTVAAVDGKLQLCADSLIGYEGLYTYLTEILLAPTGDATYTISEFTQTADATSTVEASTGLSLQTEGDVRVLFYNVYGWGNYNQVLRQKLQLEMFQTYAPDVLALQEFSNYSRTLGLQTGLNEIGYTEVQVSAGSSNFTPLFYRADRLKVVDSGYVLYSGDNDANSKSVTWAIFETLDTGKRFAAMSTHFMYNLNGSDHTSTRVSNAQEMLSVITRLRADPLYADIPFILGGDFNCKTSDSPANVLRDGGLTSAWDIALKKTDSSGHHSYPEYSATYGTFIKWSKPTGTYANSIDQIWTLGDITVNNFVTLTSFYALVSSDHSPEVVDITLQ